MRSSIEAAWYQRGTDGMLPSSRLKRPDLPRSYSIPCGKLGAIVRSALTGFVLATLEIRGAQAPQMSADKTVFHLRSICVICG
jgi:hypothetical protein